MLAIEEFGGNNAEVKERVQRRERLALRNTWYGGRGGTPIYIPWGSDMNENVFARPNGIRGKTETAISCRGSGPARTKMEMHQLSGKRKK